MNVPKPLLVHRSLHSRHENGLAAGRAPVVAGASVGADSGSGALVGFIVIGVVLYAGYAIGSGKVKFK